MRNIRRITVPCDETALKWDETAFSVRESARKEQMADAVREKSAPAKGVVSRPQTASSVFEGMRLLSSIGAKFL
jgi:hypothetical protein